VARRTSSEASSAGGADVEVSEKDFPMSQNAALPTYSAIYAFGDSLSDAGNLSNVTFGIVPASPPYYEEPYGDNVFSNGPTWVQDLSVALNLGTLKPSLDGGNDFAYGGAETGETPQNDNLTGPDLFSDASDAALDLISLPSQLAQYKLGPNPSANALYTLSIGSNDLLEILGEPSLSAQQQTIDVQDAVNNEISFVKDLVKYNAKHGGGATNLLVLNIPDLGKTPDVMDGQANGSDTPSAAFDTEASNLASEYNADLTTQLDSIASAGSLDVHVVDAYQLNDDAVADPAAYGLTNVTTPVWSGDFIDSNSGSLVTNNVTLQDQYLFWDHLHPTDTGHKALATLAENELAGTSCYAAGTHIATERGEVPVEALRVGDRVLSVLGGTARVTWLGYRRVDCRRHPKPHDVWPVRVAAGAFAANQPRRDLRLSPDHAVFVDNLLIPIRYLVNDATIVQEPADGVTYWHVELPMHDVLFAEGLPAESYLDTGNRGAFINGGAAVHAHPDFALRVWAAQACAPLVLDGPLLVAAKRDLLARATVLGHAMTDDPGLRVVARGRALAAATDGRQWRVRLPEATRTVRLISRIWSPAHMRPAEDDTRSLGVAISRLWLDRREVSLASPGLAAGWQAPEPDWRWTDGDARLTQAGVRELAFEVAMTGRYWRDNGRAGRSRKPGGKSRIAA
jgi:phospholipase/lecithinase/hemolysin